MGNAPFSDGNERKGEGYSVRSYLSGFEEFNCFMILGEEN
jgi:hypothetical protein